MKKTENIPAPPTNQGPTSTGTIRAEPQSRVSEERRSNFGSFEPRLTPQQTTLPHIPSFGNNRREQVIQPVQRIGGYGCPDIALFDSELAGELCDRRLSGSSWQSDCDAEDYDKENQCVYRENIDHADNFFSLNTDNELSLYPSPAFSEDSMMIPTSNTSASFGIQSC